MPTPKSYKGVVQLFHQQPHEIQRYFEHLPRLVSEDWSYDVGLSYMFSRVERAHRNALYCGIIKKYSANSEMAREIIRKEHLTRDKFRELFRTVFGGQFPDNLTRHIKHAEEVRDAGIHGSETSDPDLRKAIKDVLQYANDFNQLVYRLEGFKPFGDLRGFKGRGGNLEKETTRWILKGMGFSVA